MYKIIYFTLKASVYFRVLYLKTREIENINIYNVEYISDLRWKGLMQ